MEPVDREELEHIPWARLTDMAPDRTKQYLLVAALALAVGAGMLGSRLIVGGSAQTPAATPQSTQTSVLAAVDAAPAPDPTVAITQPAEEPVQETQAIYSEADLMAVLPDEEIRLAVATAESFVADYFTVDGNAATIESLGRLLPQTVVALLPHLAAASTNYVEWARAVAVESGSPGSYEVTVRYRTLASSVNGAFERSPTRAVVVRLTADAAGMHVADVPAPTDIPAVTPVELPPAEDGIDPSALDAALAEATRYGTDPELVAASRTAVGWRVIVTIGGPGDIRWPIRVDVP